MFSYFSLKFSLYIVLEAKCVRNCKSETHLWAHYPLRENKLSKFGIYRPCSWEMRTVKARHLNHPLCLLTNRSGLPVLSANWQIEANCLFSQCSAVDQRGGGGGSITLALHLPYQLSINRSLWQFRFTYCWFRNSGYFFCRQTTVHNVAFQWIFL